MRILVVAASAVLAIAITLGGLGKAPDAMAAPSPQAYGAETPVEDVIIRHQDPTMLAASQTTPEAFVRSLYAKYADDHGTDAPDNNGFYSERTAGLFEENERLYYPYLGWPDGDPICDCQDWDMLRVTDATATQIDATHARVDVKLNDQPAPRFMLVKEAGGWRIDDISGFAGGPLVAGLIASNAEARAHPVAEAAETEKQ